VAPAILVYLWSLNQVKTVGWALALLFATCCALRLARFNSELDEPHQPAWMSRFFTGMPAPAAAGCAIIPLLLAFAFETSWPRAWPLNAAVMVFVAVLMVSHVPTFSIKTVLVRVKPEWVLPTLIFAGLFLAALSSAPWHTLLAVGVVYLASLPVGWWSAYHLRRRHEQAAADEMVAPTAGPHVVSLGGPRGSQRGSRPDRS
jgi:CDP-diacylglycerol--serine O-phosphatidyltransferase